MFDQNEIIDIIVTFKTPPLSLRKSNSIRKASDLNDEHIKFKSDLEKFTSSLNNTISTQQTYKIHRDFYNAINGVSLKCTRRIMNHIQSLPMVKSIHENTAVKAYLDSSVAQIRADKVHNELGITGEGILVGIIDTGIDYLHPALGGGFGTGFRVVGGYDFYNNDADPMDDNSHGTHVAGIVGANSDSLQGVAPDVSFIAVKVLNENGAGNFDDVIAGIEYCLDPDSNPATDDAVDIINMSLGGPASADNPLDDAVNNATQAGILSVIAAGNSGYESPFSSSYESVGSPGTAKSALTVGACDGQFNMASFSSKGPDPVHLQIKPEIIAPGVNIKSSVPGNKTVEYSGTSMATPHVAGAAALLMQQHPDWTPNQIKWALVNSTQPLKVENYNPYQQGNGCVDCWNASQTDAIVEPGVLSFGLVDLALNEWRDTVSFTIQNLSNEEKTYSLSRMDNLPANVQLILSQSTVDIPAQSEVNVTAEIVVPASVPIMNNPPYAYYGKLLCTTSEDTITLPFGFIKSNVLVVEFDIPPTTVLLWEPAPNDLYSTFLETNPGQTKYTLKNMAGKYNILCSFYKESNDASPDFYIVERQDIDINGLSYVQIEHNEATFACFAGPYYNRNNELLGEDDKIKYSSLISLSWNKRSPQGTKSFNYTVRRFPYVWISSIDTFCTLKQADYYRQDDEVFALSQIIYKGVQSESDLIIPSGPENLASYNIRFKEPDERIVLDQKQFVAIVFFEFNNDQLNNEGMLDKQYVYAPININAKVTVNKEAIASEKKYFGADFLNPIEFELDRTLVKQNQMQDLFMNDFIIDQNDKIIQFERDWRVNEKYLVKRRLSVNDTLFFAPDEDVLLPTNQAFNIIDISGIKRLLFENKNGSIDYNAGGVVSSSGISRIQYEIAGLEQLMNFTIFNNGVDIPFYLFADFGYDLPLTTNTILLRGTTVPYSLLGQTGFSNVEYEISLQNLDVYNNSGYVKKLSTPPILDNFMVLANEKMAQQVTPSQDGTIRIHVYDSASDLDNLTVYAVPPSGEEIMLDLETVQEKREYIVHIPNDLPHEFIDVILRMEDKKGNKTTYTAAPAFFFGNTQDDIAPDSRVWMSNYYMQNSDDFPFTTGDTLTFNLEYSNIGRNLANNIYVKFPTTSMFAPVNSDSISFTISSKATIELKLETLQPHPVNTLLAYYPELHWTSNGKSYMRRYPVRIKTSGNPVTSVDDNNVNHTLTYQLMNNYPNPFNPATTIRFQIPQTEHVTIIVYDILGREVNELTDDLYNAGDHQILWDGTNQYGQTVASGLYIYRIKAGDFVQSKKMLLLK